MVRYLNDKGNRNCCPVEITVKYVWHVGDKTFDYYTGNCYHRAGWTALNLAGPWWNLPGPASYYYTSPTSMNFHCGSWTDRFQSYLIFFISKSSSIRKIKIWQLKTKLQDVTSRISLMHENLQKCMHVDFFKKTDDKKRLISWFFASNVQMERAILIATHDWHIFSSWCPQSASIKK